MEFCSIGPLLISLERMEDGEEVRVCDPGDTVYGRKLMIEDLLVMWKTRELHQIAELEEVTFIPSSGRLGLLFRIDWEVWLRD